MLLGFELGDKSEQEISTRFDLFGSQLKIVDRLLIR